MKPGPAFLISLPRSGSTLVQRMIAAHPEVATEAEPWFLLPLLSIFRRDAMVADYNHFAAVGAVQEFDRNVLGGSLRSLLSEFVSKTYAEARGPAKYFLDKTPRYSLVARQVADMFMESPIIVLVREPLAITGSMLRLDPCNRFNLYRWKADLLRGLPELCDLLAEKRPNVLRVRYEDLVQDPRHSMRKICDFLGVDVASAMVDRFQSVELSGMKGDRGTLRTCGTVREVDVVRYREYLTPVLRQKWLKRYFEWVGEDRFQLLGYDLEQTMRQMESLGCALFGRILSDLLHVGLVEPLVGWIDPYLLRQRWRGRSDPQTLVAYH